MFPAYSRYFLLPAGPSSLSFMSSENPRIVLSGDHNAGLPGLDEGADFQCSGPLVCFGFRRFGVHAELAQLAFPCSVDRSPASTLSHYA